MTPATITELAVVRRQKTSIREDATSPGVWRVEAVEFGGSGCAELAVFVGAGAERRAREYACWKYRTAS